MICINLFIYLIYFSRKVTREIPHGWLGFIKGNPSPHLLTRIVFDFFSKQTSYDENNNLGKIIHPGRYSFFYEDEVGIFENKEYSITIEDRVLLSKSYIEFELKVLIHYRIVNPIVYFSHALDAVIKRISSKLTESITYESYFDKVEISGIQSKLKEQIDNLKLSIVQNYGLYISDCVIQLKPISQITEQFQKQFFANGNRFDEIKMKIIEEEKLENIFSKISNKHNIPILKLYEYYIIKNKRVSIFMIQSHFDLDLNEDIESLI